MTTTFAVHPSYLVAPVTQPISVPELYDWHAQNNREHPLYIYEDTPGHQRIITMGEGVQAFHRATQFVRNHIEVDSRRGRCIVAILAWSETTAYISTVIGIMRAGFTAHPISPRNNPRAIAHLLTTASVTHLLISSEPAIQALYEASTRLLSEGFDKPQTITMPTFEHFFPGGGFDPTFQPVSIGEIDINSIACIYHTSGTTSLPEPIRLTHRALYCFSTVPTFSEIKLTGVIYGCHSIPIFHGMGWMPLTFPASVGLTISVFKPRFPPTEATPENVLQEATSVNSDILLCAPTLPEHWSEYPDDVKCLAKMKGIVIGGAPLTKVTGNALAAAGVNLICQYGSTQTALLSKFISDAAGMDWEYFNFSPGWTIRLKDYGNGSMEAVVLDSDEFKPYMFNSTFEDKPAYATGDLLTPHPLFPGRFKIVGRVEEQLKHTDGTVTNPTPIEHMFNKEIHIEASIVFGHGRAQCGVLIQPRNEFRFDPSDAAKLESFRSAIQPAVMRINELVPKQSRISKDMIIIATPEKPFQYTLKQTLRRQIMINEYAKEIDDHYSQAASKIVFN